LKIKIKLWCSQKEKSKIPFVVGGKNEFLRFFFLFQRLRGGRGWFKEIPVCRSIGEKKAGSKQTEPKEPRSGSFDKHQYESRILKEKGGNEKDTNLCRYSLNTKKGGRIYGCQWFDRNREKGGRELLPVNLFVREKKFHSPFWWPNEGSKKGELQGIRGKRRSKSKDRRNTKELVTELFFRKKITGLGEKTWGKEENWECEY